MGIYAEISVIPVSRKGGTDVSRQVAAAFDAIRKTRGVKATLTALGTQIDADNIGSVLRAVNAAHKAVKQTGAVRIISTIRIDERLDKTQTLEDKIRSIKKELAAE